MSYYFYQNYKYDHTPRLQSILSAYPGAVNNIQAAEFGLDMRRSFVTYMSRCRRFPESVQGFYQPIKGDKPQYCQPFDPLSEEHKPWLDPWDRPYEIRYDRERAKLQIRSLGRYWWWPWDNIQDETNLAVPTDLVEPERQKCDQGLDCIYSRGWH